MKISECVVLDADECGSLYPYICYTAYAIWLDDDDRNKRAMVREVFKNLRHTSVMIGKTINENL